MMNRRWFFTAAGSAFVAAACTTVRGRSDSPPTIPESLPLDPNSQWTALLASFYEGVERERDKMLAKVTVPPEKFPRHRIGPEGLRKIFDDKLREIYWDRFQWRISHKEDWTETVFKEALHQACILGQLTALAFAYHTGVAGDPKRFSFDEQKPKAKLDVKHLEWARDMYGFYTNKNVTKRDRQPRFPELELCHVDIGAEINEPCPFCFG